ncbi:MAG: CRISPR-associated endoribonuclease Cas6 [Candidatus Nitrosocaldaceae archaeon]|nr:MAG: CRISPR-associated endoribonuclease Cas6 [Candidatus Nitrosocaldaceae archaeon]
MLLSYLLAKVILQARFRFNVDRDIIIPPFSPKVSKILLHSISELYSNIYSSNISFKPLSISPILSDDKPLLKYGITDRPLILYANKQYSFITTLILNENDTFNDMLDLSNNSIKLFNSTATIDSINITIRRFDNIKLDISNGFVKMVFVSPILIQLPSYGRFKRGRHLLFPIPSIMMRSLIDHWNTYAPIQLRVKNPIYASLYSNYMLVEVDHYIKPVTVVYDKRRKPRGFIGWTVYKVVKSRSKYNNVIQRLLAYSNYIGIGRSRSTGFGNVNTFILSDKQA